MEQIPEDISKEKNTTEQTITVLVMRLNQSVSYLDSLIKFPPKTMPHNRNMYRSVYCDIFELSRLTRASLSNELIKKLDFWRTNFNSSTFVSTAIEFTENIYDELSESGMIEVRARKTSTFPIKYYIDQIPKL